MMACSSNHQMNHCGDLQIEELVSGGDNPYCMGGFELGFEIDASAWYLLICCYFGVES
jgi:hypothetical protein